MDEREGRLGAQDAARLARIARRMTSREWEKIQHAPWIYGISPAVIDLLEQVTDADGTVSTWTDRQFRCDVGGAGLTITTGVHPAFEGTHSGPVDLPHLRALANLPVAGGHERHVTQSGPRMTVTVRTPHDSSGSELANAVQAVQDLGVALREAGQLPGAAYDDLVADLTSAGLGVPRIPTAFRDKIQKWDQWWWATEQSASPFEDYLLQSEALLEQPVADHVAITHAGHGLDSYALNWRQAFGPVAFLVQTGWGGGLSDNAFAIGRQAELFARTSGLTRVLEDRGVALGGTRIRRLLITVSDFRDVLRCRQWNGALARWEQIELDEREPWEQLEGLVHDVDEVT